MQRVFVAAALITVAIAGIGWHTLHVPAEAIAPPAPPPAIPVETATVGRADLPVYRIGLGSVQAFNTVTVRTRVDGELQKVAFTEGQAVKVGDVLAQIDPRPFQAQLDQAIALLAQDNAKLANARLDLNRFRDLATRAFATRQSVDTQTALVSQLEGAVKGDQAAIENARVQLGYTTISSPLNGRTGIRLVDQGNIVHAVDTGGLVVLTQLQPISVVFTLPEAEVPALRAAMARGPVAAVAVSQDSRDALDRGTVALLDNLIDQTTGTIRLKATFPNTAEALWPGQFVTVRVLLRTDADVVAIPASAVQHAPDGLYVYVVKPDQTVERRDVSIGGDGDGQTEIAKGLAPGEQVVTAGQYRLQPGARVAPGALATAS
jgi:multidrug efflux system membrane fusion protein